MAKKLSKELENIIVENYNKGISPYTMVKTIEKLKDKKPSSIYGVLQRLGIKSHRPTKLTSEQKLARRKYDVNDNYFESIDTEEKAYWLGFLYADGWLTTLLNKIGITIGVEDYDHLVKFKNAVKSESQINVYTQEGGFKKGGKYARIVITSEKMKKDLIKHGMYEHKTEIVTFPYNEMSKDLYRHFIRGYLDGDGSISHSKILFCGNKSFSVKFAGTKEMLNSIKEILNVNVKLFKRYKDRDVNNYDITIGGNIQVKRVLDFLYKDSTIYLTRKHDKFLELVKQCAVN